MLFRKFSFFSACILCAVFLLAAHSVAATLEEVISGLEKRLSETASISAEFAQEAVSSGIGNKVMSQGVVYIKKPGRMKWVYAEPHKDILASNGKLVWFYQEDLNQVMEMPASRMSSAGRDFLLGAGSIRKDFSIKLTGDDEKSWSLELLPKEADTGLKRLFVKAGKEDFVITSITIEDTLGNRTVVEYRNIKVNPAIKDSFFDFKPPKGAKVVK
ncbi:MAG: outer membrane lipoprotein chaperone LolA [Deltaproteobacteria bacterium]|nr:outer membrane lipoprotein chaperone LolA [Deltaproteobacteria bacterium]